jgi:hypothetical protein
MATISEKVLQKLSEIENSLSTHFERDRTNCEKIDATYKLLVTGNGCPPLTETVRNHHAWIEEQKKRRGEQEKNNNSIVLLIVGQLISLGGMAVAIWLGLK